MSVPRSAAGGAGALSEAEATLLERARQGDIPAFEGLVNRHAGQLYNLALRMLGNAEDAQDVVQEALVKAYLNIRGFRGRSAVSTWLYRITYNLCLDEIKRRGRQAIPFSALGEEGTAAAEVLARPDERGPEEQALSAELQRAVHEALGQLSEQYRVVLILYEIHGLSYEEIAEITGTRLGTVKSRLNRARWQLKELMEEHRELFEV